MSPRLRVPLKLAVVAVGAGLAGCPDNGPPAARACAQYECTTDAAAAVACSDAAPPSGTPYFTTDLGACFLPT
jgi:hypothetical protein